MWGAQCGFDFSCVKDDNHREASHTVVVINATFSTVAEKTADDSRILSGRSDVQMYCSFESLWGADSAVSNKMTPWIGPNKVPLWKFAHVSTEDAFDVSSNYT